MNNEPKNDPGEFFALFSEAKKITENKILPKQTNIIKSYRKFESIVEKEKLIEKYGGLVNQCVRRISMVLPPHIDTDDLASEGIIGLIDAIEKFDPDRGTDFTTYAALRIKGSIIDSLRQKDWVPRNLRDLSKEIDKARNHLENEFKRTVTQEELAGHMGISPRKLSFYQSKIKNAEVVSLDEVISLSNSYETKISRSTGDVSEGGDSEVERKERVRVLKDAIMKLKPRERLILSLYYFEELSLKEMNHLLGISMPRISQIHKNVLKKLKGFLKDQEDILSV